MSMRVCFDASAALAFALNDETWHTQAKVCVRQLAARGATLCAPPLFAYECESVIRLRVFKGTLDEIEAQEARACIHALMVAIDYDPADEARAYQIARDYHQPRCYDALYAAYAEARNVELVTTDEPFFEAVNGAKRPKSVPALAFVTLLRGFDAGGHSK